MKDNATHFELSGQVQGRNRANALSVENHSTHVHTVPLSEQVPSGLNVGINVRFAGPTSTLAVPGVVVAEDVAVQKTSQANVEARHLPEVDSVAVREKNRPAW